MASMFLSSNVNNIVSLIITKGGEDFDRSIIQDNQCYVVMDDFSNLIQSIPSYINRLSQVQEIQNVGGIDYNIVLIANSKDEYEQISAYDQNKLGNYTLVVKKNYKELEQNDIQQNKKMANDDNLSQEDKKNLEEMFHVELFQTTNNGVIRNYIRNGNKVFEGSLKDMYIQFREMCSNPNFKQELSKFKSKDELVNYFMQKYMVGKKEYLMNDYVSQVSNNEKGDLSLGVAENNHAMVNPELGIVYDTSKKDKYTAISEKGDSLVVNSPQVSNGVVGSNNVYSSSTSSYTMDSAVNRNSESVNREDHSLSSNSAYENEDSLQKKNENKNYMVKRKVKPPTNGSSGIVNFALIMLMLISAIIMGFIVYSLV